MNVVIMGGGKVGSYLAKVLLEKGHEVSVLESNKAQADQLSIYLTGQYTVICGDGCDSDFQEDANIKEADVFVAATGRDDDNLVACEIATRVFNVPRCIARVNNPKNARIFGEVGIESVSSTALIANLIEEEALLGGVGVVSALSRGDIVLIEIGIPNRMKHFDPEEGVPAPMIALPEGALLAAIDRLEEGDAEIATIESVLYPGDKAVIMAESEVVDEVRALFAHL